MNLFNRSSQWALPILVMSTLAFALGGCEGSDGAAGAAGPAGSTGPAGPAGPPAPGSDPVMAAIDSAKVESCATCHGDVGVVKHQALYDRYTDKSADAGTNLTLAFTSFTSDPAVAPDTGFDVTLTIEITRNGLPLVNIADLAMTNRFYVTRYDGAGQYFDGNQRIRTVTPTATAGEFIVSGNIVFDPSAADSQFFGYVGDEQVIIDDVNYAAHMGLYDNIASASLATGSAQAGDAAAYASAANVSACETCHGVPYMKHGNRRADVAGLPDFAACKSCHYDDRTGGHEDWQYMVDEPLNWANGVAATADYAYTANLMNDVHMSHAMEFPYPQSMSNCATCHAGKLTGPTGVLDNSNFTLETCKSCHAIQGVDAWPEYTAADGTEVDEGKYYQSARAPALDFLWTQAGVTSVHDPVASPNCQGCHGNGISREFNAYHGGYDVRITDSATGIKYADTYTATIDDIALAADVLTVTFSVSDPAMVPYIYVSFYGWDSKHMILASHTSDGSTICTSRSGNPGGCRLESRPGDGNPLFVYNAVDADTWEAVIDLTAYVPTTTLPDDIPTLILNGVVKTGIVTIAPRFETAGAVDVGLDAVVANFDAFTGAPVPNYFTDLGKTVDNAKCEVCHDKLAVTFHSGSGRSKVEACRNCHVTTSPGSHLEMASRSIDSYVHAVHSFQAFDIGDVEFTDAVEAARYEHHIHATFPNFTITNCEACHVAGTYNVPDQSKSMPGLLARSDTVANRNIGTVGEKVTGAASRACGACHRAELINEDRAGDLAAFNAHTEAFGTYEENDDDDVVLYGIIDKIMSLF